MLSGMTYAPISHTISADTASGTANSRFAMSSFGYFLNRQANSSPKLRLAVVFVSVKAI